jgi:hypothetical protein
MKNTNKINSFLDATSATILVRGRTIQTVQSLSTFEKEILGELIEEFNVEGLNLFVKSYVKAGFGNYYYGIASSNEKSIRENLEDFINQESELFKENATDFITEALETIEAAETIEEVEAPVEKVIEEVAVIAPVKIKRERSFKLVGSKITYKKSA